MKKTYEYEETTANCVTCGSLITYQIRIPIYPSRKKRKYCKNCLPERIKLAAQKSSRKRGERYMDNQGYIYIKVDNHRVAEHRHVMSQILGRQLRKGEMVHHIDGNPQNNKSDNLELWVKSSHICGQRAKDIICPHCGKPYLSD